MNLLNSSFVDHKSGEDDGPAIFNGGVISKTVGVYFFGNGYIWSPETCIRLSEVCLFRSDFDSFFRLIAVYYFLALLLGCSPTARCHTTGAQKTSDSPPLCFRYSVHFITYGFRVSSMAYPTSSWLIMGDFPPVYSVADLFRRKSICDCV